jgi:hypothetical protein
MSLIHSFNPPPTQVVSPSLITSMKTAAANQLQKSEIKSQFVYPPSRHFHPLARPYYFLIQFSNDPNNIAPADKAHQRQQRSFLISFNHVEF